MSDNDGDGDSDSDGDGDSDSDRIANQRSCYKQYSLSSNEQSIWTSKIERREKIE